MSAETHDNVRHLPHATPSSPDAAGPAAMAAHLWPDKPAPITTLGTLAPFPVAALPTWLGAYAEAVAHTIQTPLDLSGALALATLSTAAGGRVMVEVRPSWREQATLFTVVIMEPSARKSPVFTAMTEPIRALEKLLREEARHSIETAKMHQAMAESAREKAAKEVAALAGDQLSDDSSREEAIADAVDAALRAEAIAIPHAPQLIVDDVTPEQVATILADQGGRLSVLSDEGTVFGIVAGRYSGGVNAEVFLKGYSGTELRVNRGNRAEHVPRPALTMGLTIQPAVIEDLPGKLRGNGFLARILFARPAPLSGRRTIRPGPIPADVADTYMHNMLALATELHGFEEPITLTFSQAADDLMADIETEIEPKLDPENGEWADIGDWAGKLAGQTARIAALLHLAAHPNNAWNHPQISADTVADAWCIASYYATHAQATLAKIGESPAVAVAEKILDKVTARTWPHGHRFQVKDLFKAIRCKAILTMKDLQAGLDLLDDLGHVAAEPEPVLARRGRRPSPFYWLHPEHRR
ncbi:YfjI family protein [Amycolatopsis sp. lyj-346]|uniref:YfjI family protein n=1 Tax=Amycolatopsis sp. lyj-346 TaxID=2789289 RepID=UPI00397BBC25